RLWPRRPQPATRTSRKLVQRGGCEHAASYARAAARFEKSLQWRNVRHVRPQLYDVDSFGTQVALQPLRALHRNLVETLPYRRPRRVELNDLAGFGVLQSDDSDVGKLSLAWIFDMDSDQVVAAIGLADHSTQVRASGNRVTAAGHEIRDQEYDRAPMQHVIHDIERLDSIGADPLRLVIENVAHDAQHMPAPFLGRQVPL